MKYLLAFLLLTFGSYTIEAQIKRALIIGIGAYPPESGWSTIHGDNDVPLIAEALIKRGFSHDNIVKLVNEQASKKNIVKKINLLIGQANSNDIIYIHFSTHGQQVVDLDGDEKDTLDEAIIPYDAYKTYVKGVYEGQCHLIDDELYSFLSALRKKIGKSGTLIVAIDACHSGDATRGKKAKYDSVIVRGTSDIFQAEGKKRVSFIPRKSVDWVAISATQPYQNNYEYKIGGKYYGSLSYAIFLALPGLTSKDNYSRMFKAVQKNREEMDVSRYPQRPMIEGDSFYLNQPVF